ncbi:AgmX/PglI C-terminal domain-containing protein [Marinobacter sp. 1_MG-2023]|uniref:AgmX/PglI C-terminal domain-containing protein n=1 Tax=Marinobacter sp. 1_MG-2023 TaxID=3062627 RepID=UPI0026E29F22|nr:AgmX/PglI C-terminal domain-containing protein [Marinobacter sp. 1_MG-2023]MDO6823446.1 AgmX/PglI C-terminal domain-containing protein [Marinobacter sp. 1_MG-2023]
MTDYRYGLPWSHERGERRRLLSVALVVAPLFVIFAGYITWIDLPERDRQEREALPPQLAKLVIEKKEPPKPVVPEPEPEPEKKTEEKPVEQPKPEPEPEPKPAPKPKPEPPKPEVKEKPKPEAVAQAREKAKSTGILAMGNELSKLSELASSVKLDAPVTRTAKSITRKSTADTLAARATTNERSAGVSDATLERESRQVVLEERERTEVAETERVAEVKEAVRREKQETASRTRSKEELRRTMDANKSAIYSIYNRELRRKPSLQGSITPELVIESSGAVSQCSVVESTLGEPGLENKICNRLRLVDFGARPGVDQTTIRYPIELLSG